MQEPLVSIVIPTYKPLFLEAAIESALAQTHPRVEISVSDQCPTDAVRDMVARYPQIRYVRNPVPGVYSNFRNCMKIARGEFVKFLLDDDLLWPHCIATMLEAFRSHEGVTLVSGWYQLIDDSGKEIGLRSLSEKTLVSTPGGGAAPMLISTRNPVGPLTSCMFRRSAMPLGHGPWFFTSQAPDLYFGLMDMCIVLDLAFRGRVVMLPERLSAMRIHADQLSNPGKNPGAVNSVRSWVPILDDAYAYGLLNESQRLEGLQNALAQFRRMVGVFPSLGADIESLQTRLQGLQSPPGN